MKQMSSELVDGVEFFGPPGSGKTTIGITLEKDLPDFWIRSDRFLLGKRRSARALRILSLVAGNPGLTLSLLALCSVSGVTNIRKRTRICCRILSIWYYLHRRGQVGKKKVVFDHGGIQLICSLLYGGPENRTQAALIRRILRYIYRNTRIVFFFLNLNGAAAAKRIMNRKDGLSRLDGLSLAEIEEHSFRNIWVFDLVAKCLAMEGFRFFRIDSCRSVELNVKIVNEIFVGTRT